MSGLKDVILTLQERGLIMHAIMLCESLMNETNENLCQLPGYTLVSNNKADGQGGGVVIYIMDSMSFSRRPDLDVNVSKNCGAL